MAVPWSVKHFVTQDGPAHVYTASVTKDLLFHRRTSPYHAMYRVQKKPLPNWTCTVLLMGWLSLFGPDYAEAFLTTLCLLVGYFSFRYCLRSIHSKPPPLLLVNWMIQSWFLWAGFYNFTLGMMLLPLAIGVYLRGKRPILLSCVLLLIFFTHLIPAALAVMAIGIIAVWEKRGLPWALGPTIALLIVYAAQFRGGRISHPEVLTALRDFPSGLFIYSSGWAGEQRYVWIAVLAAILISMAAGVRRLSPLAVCSAAAFGLYLVTPDVGFGGSVVKLRLAWAVFLFGCLLIRTPFIAMLGVITVAQLLGMAGHARRTSDAASLYFGAMNCLPKESRFVRLHYTIPAARERFGMDQIAISPLLHLSELGAVYRHAVDLSDYQAATGTFSVDFKPFVNDGQRYSLWGFETSGDDSWAAIQWINGGIPDRITHVVWFGEAEPKAGAPAKLICSTPGTPPFVKIYELR